MEYFVFLLKKFGRSIIKWTSLALILWGILYHLTDSNTIKNYLLTGIVICFINTIIGNLANRKTEKIFNVKFSWVIMAGAVLLLYHAGFTAASVLAAAAITALPFFGGTIQESIVGISLLIAIAYQP